MTVIVTPPAFKFKCAFGNNPLDSSPTFTDISPYVIDFHFKYGRQFELNRFETGTADFKLDNTDRRFDPTNTASPYYPNVQPLKLIQVTAPNVLPTDAVSNLTVTSQAAGSGSVGYVVTGTPGTYGTYGAFTATRVTAPATLLSNTAGWVAFNVNMGFASGSPPSTPQFFYWANAGNTHSISVDYGAVAGKWSVTYNNGATTRANITGSFSAGQIQTVVAYWTGTTVGISVNGSVFTTAAISGSAISDLVSTTFDIGSNVGTTKYCDSGITWFACGTGTLADADAVTIDALPTSLSIWTAGISVMQPVGDASMMLWPPTCSLTAVWPAASASYRIPSTAYVWTGYVTDWPMAWEGPEWSETDCLASDALQILSLAEVVSAAASLTTVQGSNKDLTFTCKGTGSGGNSVTIAYVNNATSPPTVTTIGLAVQVNMTQGTTTANQILTAVNADATANLLVTASLATGSTGVGTPTAFAATNLSGGTFQQELSGAQIGHVLDNIGWPATWRSIDTGVYTVSAVVFKPGDHQKAKAHINDVENSELGYTFVNGQGYVVYHDQHHRVTAASSTTAQAIFGDSPTAGAELEYDNITVVYNEANVYNYAGVTPYNGSTAQIAQDATSQASYVLRSYTMSTQLTNTTDALGLAQVIVYRYKQPAVRIGSLDFTPMNDVGLWLQFFARTIGDRVIVTRRPNQYGATGAPMITSDVFVESVEATFKPGLLDLAVKYELSPTSLFGIQLILDDATYGKLDSGNTLGF